MLNLIKSIFFTILIIAMLIVGIFSGYILLLLSIVVFVFLGFYLYFKDKASNTSWFKKDPVDYYTK